MGAKKVEILQKQGSESNKMEIPDDETKTVELNKLSDPDLIATLKGIKIEEQELLQELEHLQTTEGELRNQAVVQIDEKKRALKGLKSQVIFLQNKCYELEQALGIPVYK